MLLTLSTRSCSSGAKSSWHCVLSREARRCFSRSNLWQCRQSETLSLNVGGNGFVNLDILRPTQHTQNKRILVRFPPGPVPAGFLQARPPLNSSVLHDGLPDATIVDVQYRLQPRSPKSETDHRFPIPIHDVFTAWDYISNELSIWDYMAGTKSLEPKICLYGSHIGGALALSLALTNPSDIHAITIEDPLVDWPILDEVAVYDGSKRKTPAGKVDRREAQAEAARELIKLRTRLFRTPSAYFDSFASPTLFLRAPGRDTPLHKTAAPVDPEIAYVDGVPMRYGEEEDEVGLVEYDRDDYGPYDDDWHAVETRKIRNEHYRVGDDAESTRLSTKDSGQPVAEGSDGSSDPNSLISTRRRKVLRRWPPVSQPEEVLLPYVDIILNGGSVVEAHSKQGVDISPVTRLQGRELQELLRRACFWGREKGLAEERVTLTEFENSVGEAERQEKLLWWVKTRLDEQA